MPSHKEISLEIESSYGHIDPLPPSELCLKTIELRVRTDKIWGDTFFGEDESNEADFSNQGCTSNSRFVDNGLQQKWRDYTPISDNNYST